MIPELDRQHRQTQHDAGNSQAVAYANTQHHWTLATVMITYGTISNEYMSITHESLAALQLHNT